MAKKKPSRKKSSKKPPARRPAATARRKTPRPARKAKRPAPPQVMADDIPEKVQAEFRQSLADGLSTKEATERLVKNWRKLLRSKQLQEEFWLALAGTQWQLGRLEPAIKKRALAYIDQGLKPAPRKPGSDEETVEHRHKALWSLRGILTSKQPPKREIPRSKAPSSDEFQWPVGEIFAYKLLSGRLVLFHIVACLGEQSTGYWPVFALLDWIGDERPSAGVIKGLPLKTDPHAANLEAIWMVSVIRRHASDFMPERIEWLRIQREPHVPSIDRGFVITYWKEKLDEKLRFDFGWE